ncbi:hypothetical protein ES702_07709 [subsurface metagenome]
MKKRKPKRLFTIVMDLGDFLKVVKKTEKKRKKKPGR